jgi:hypothetical protein
MIKIILGRLLQLIPILLIILVVTSYPDWYQVPA